MRLESDYWHALDKQAAQDYQVNSEDIGITANPSKGALEQLRSKVFEGAKNVEIGFVSTGKGSLAQGGTTPEMYGRENREDIRELAKINEVETSIHAAVNLQGFAGLGEGGFREEIRENNLKEVKRTLDFAADTAGGGPVVIHTGEFPRSIQAIEPGKFEAFEKEEEKATVYLVDKTTGQVQQTFRKDTEIIIPIKKEVNGEIQIIAETKKYSDLEKQFKDLPKELPYGADEKTTDYQEKYNGKVEKYVYSKIFDARKKGLEAESQRFEEGIRGLRDGIKDYKIQRDRLLKMSKAKAAEFVIKNFTKPETRTESTIQEINKDPIEYVNTRIREQGSTLQYYEEGVGGYKAQAADLEKNAKNIQTIEEYGIKKSAETLGRAGVYAYEREKAEGLKKPLFIAPENIFPEQYGSHPKELRNLIVKSREQMAKQLHRDRGMSMYDAKKIAEDHIKATFDVGHAYTWKKYFKPKEGESLKQTDKRFDKWLQKEVKSLAKDKIIGHVHISDNFGYHDEHLTPGQGHVPIRDFVKTLKKQGFDKKMIIEAGAQPENQISDVMTGAWRTLNSPIYRTDSMYQSWSDIGQSYFAKTGSPSYVVGDYAPSKDWTLWSETQLE